MWRSWLQHARRRPSVLALTLAGLLGLLAAPALVLAGAALLAQLVAGLAVAPLALAVYLSLFPLGPLGGDGDDDGRDGGVGRPGGDPDGPGPAGDPDAGIDWDRFEREFWGEVGRYERARSRTPALT